MATRTARRGPRLADRRVVGASGTFPVNGAGAPTGWTQVVSLGSVSVVANQLTLTTPTGPYAGGPAVIWSSQTAIADFEATYDIGVTDLSEQYPTISFRGDAANGTSQYPLNGLGLEFQPASGHWLASKTVAGTRTQLGSGDFAVVAGTRVKVRERCVGGVWQVRMWNAGTAEPTTWNLDITNAGVVAAGKVFLGTNNGGDGAARTFTFDNIVVTAMTGGSTAAMPTSEPAGWSRIFSEDFTTPIAVGGFVVGAPGAAEDGLLLSSCAAYAAYYNKINLYGDNSWDTNHFAKYWPSKTVSTLTGVPNANGVMDVYFHTETINGVSTALSAWLRPRTNPDAQKRLYTRMSMRMRADPSAGYGAVMLSIADPWPQNGELDFPEGPLNASIEGWYHYADPAATSGTSGNYQLHVTPTPASYWQDWHVYTQEWSPGRVRWLIDSTVVLDTTDRVPAVTAQHVLQSGGTTAQPPASTTGHLQIDWITLADWTG